MTSDMDDFFDVAKGNATVRQAKAYLDQAWELLMRRAGRQEAERYVLGKLGYAKTGRPQNNDEIDCHIRLSLAAAAQAADAKKISTKRIADVILASPPHRRLYRTKNGPNAGCYIDPETGDKEYEPDLELGSEPVNIKIKRTSLETRIGRIKDQMIKTGELSKKYKNKYSARDQ
jgi:hypothetical protein